MNRSTIKFACLSLLVLSLTSCHKKDSYNPKDYLSPALQDTILYKTIRYSAKLPPGATHQNKFDAKFDAYYRKAVSDYRFLKLKEADGYIEFLIARPAKSISVAFEGIGGKLKLNEDDSLVEYEEVFRTWKMPYEELTERGHLIFDRMVNKRDLTLYYPKYTGDKYIEFPDERFSFDKKTRIWVDKAFSDTLLSK